jgi:hypothetical protein
MALKLKRSYPKGKWARRGGREGGERERERERERRERFFSLWLEVELRALHMLGKYTTTELYPQPSTEV